uniref:Putative secreted protein n=1 Tax=Ixodes ricinus TaxID=34613 RepID=A0A6B0U9T9_IXORI
MQGCSTRAALVGRFLAGGLQVCESAVCPQDYPHWDQELGESDRLAWHQGVSHGTGNVQCDFCSLRFRTLAFCECHAQCPVLSDSLANPQAFVLCHSVTSYSGRELLK